MNARNPRVMLTIGSAERGGAEGQLVRLAAELRHRGVDVRVMFLTEGGPLTAVLDEAGVPWSAPPAWTGHMGPLAALPAAVRVATWLIFWRPDVVSAWLPGAVLQTLPLARWLSRAARVAAFRGRVPAASARRGRYAERLHEYAVRHAHAVTINAPALEDEALRFGADPARIHLIPNGVSLADTLADVTVQPPTAVLVANFRRYKGHDVLVEALALVPEPLVVRLVGTGETRRAVAAAAERLGLTERIVLVDAPADVAAELRRAQFAIHPSRTEGLSNAILEELAAGLPVVATDVGGTALLVEDEVNGFLVPAGDPTSLARGISRLAGSPELRAKLAPEARLRAERFSWDACAEAYLTLFTSVSRRWR